ncbi:MAG TPA: FAD-dependent oxidoreductase, partial [Burkholderiaceae bacterium]|nr:FAD-dependent oxidoreductase [Burkholderiaceae bacterium]
RVTVYEKNPASGGRMHTRETELGGFDVGAQYFTARSAAFKKQVMAWRQAGWLARWDGRLAKLEAGRMQKAGGNRQRWVAVPGMDALCRQLAQEVDVRREQRVMAIEGHGDAWLLKVQADSVPIAASAGPFDAVIVALPAPQAASLLQIAPALAQQAAKVHLAPCWALALAFQETLDLPYDGAWVHGSRLGWIARDTSKPQRRPGEHWVAQATPGWSSEHLEDAPERARDKLLKAFQEATGRAVQPVYAAIHCWRFAQAERPLAGACLWQAKLRIGACGDWFAAGLEGSGRVENAWLSGLALAEQVA